MRQPLLLDEAIQALKRDPTQLVRVKVDEELTVEVRAVEPAATPKRSAADAFRELGRWEGETDADCDALFGDVRQRSNHQVELLFGAEKSVRKEQNGACIKQMSRASTCPFVSRSPERPY